MELFRSDPVETSASNLTLHRYRRTNQGFVEDLGNGVTMTLMLIPEGDFMMGSAEEEPDGRDEERPQHLVRVPKFLMGKYPVTQAQWRAVAEIPLISQELTSNPSRFQGDSRPVEQISWYEAVEFCERLSVYTKRDYGLPSEAEWEYACRAGTQTPFHFGEMITTEVVNCCEGEFKSNNQEGTTPVDYFGMANVFGLGDMHGNVWEWCQDHWDRSYENSLTNGKAWLISNENAARILRGGSWSHYPKDCRSASRFFHAPDACSDTFGVRVVCRATV